MAYSPRKRRQTAAPKRTLSVRRPACTARARVRRRGARRRRQGPAGGKLDVQRTSCQSACSSSTRRPRTSARRSRSSATRPRTPSALRPTSSSGRSSSASARGRARLSTNGEGPRTGGLRVHPLCHRATDARRLNGTGPDVLWSGPDCVDPRVLPRGRRRNACSAEPSSSPRTQPGSAAIEDGAGATVGPERTRPRPRHACPPRGRLVTGWCPRGFFAGANSPVAITSDAFSIDSHGPNLLWTAPENPFPGVPTISYTTGHVPSRSPPLVRPPRTGFEGRHTDVCAVLAS